LPPKPVEAARRCLIVTSQEGLSRSLDRAGVDEALGCLGHLAEANRLSGIDTLLYVPDGKSSPAALPAIEGRLTAAKLAAAIRSVEKEVCAGQPITYVFLVGDGDAVPFHDLENPAGDSDSSFPSDAPYGVVEPTGDDDAHLIPDRGVGRIPLNGDKHNGRNLVSYLEDLVGGAAGQRGRAFGLGAAVWKDQAQKVFGQVSSEALRCSPPLDLESFEPAWLAARAVLYFNVHGSKEDRYWYGQEGLSYPRALSPEIVAKAAPAGSLVVSEACYGGLIEGRGPETSIALQFVSKGVSAFVGSSAIAYGSPDQRLTEADLLAYRFLKRVMAGESYGDAFRESKVDFAAEMLKRQGYLDGDDRKTLIEFNLFGCPTLSLTGAGEGGGRGKMISDDVMDVVKRIAVSRFPEMDGVEPEVAEERTALDGSLARKVMERRPASREKASRFQGRIFVASFKRVVVTGDRSVERVVRITFDERGGVLKIVTSK
jgi:hypothetical protein